MTKPIREMIKGLRQRRRADGTWRVWWEPTSSEKALGFAATDLDNARPAWTIRQAGTLNRDVARALSGETPAVRGARRSTGGRTMTALIEEYTRARFFRDLRPASRRSYTGFMAVIDRKWGAALVTDFTKPVMNKWYEAILDASGTYQAKALLRMMSILFSHAERIGWRAEQSNPCFNLQIKSGQKRSRTATWAEFDALIAAAQALGLPHMACAIALSTLHAQRQTDVIHARLDAFRHMTRPVGTGSPQSTATGRNEPAAILCWELMRSKRRTYGAVPIHPEALHLLRRAIAAAPKNQDYLLPDPQTLQPFTVDKFNSRWTAIRTLAARTQPGLIAPGNILQFRDLRRTFGVWARAGGASKADVGDVLGNAAGQDPGLGETYMPAGFETAARAINAVQRPHSDKAKRA